MRIIEIAPLDNGAHRNQNGDLSVIPEGWAVVPADLETENFPFGEVEVTDVDGVATVTSWSPLPIPEPEPMPEPAPSQLDIIEAQVTYTAMMTDTLLEV
jgi:hypothetical protein